MVTLMSNVSNPDVYSANAAYSDYLSCLWSPGTSRSILNSNQILYRARHLAIFLSRIVDDRTSCDFNGNLFINLEELIFEELHCRGFCP